MCRYCTGMMAVPKNITLIDKKNIHNNRLQVINQYEVKQADGARHDNRYDVTILVNGFPLVHVELKRRGVAIREAFNQINRYQRDSFWAGCGLYEYAQIFVISNGTNTKYYSNSTRYNAIKDAKHGKTKKEKTSNSFEFTSYWADANNRVLTDLIDFTRTFFAKHTILSVLTRYCIFTSEKMLMVMRPYQITATERILNRIEIANNYKNVWQYRGWRLHLAHHWLRQDANLLQNGTAGIAAAIHRQGAVCGRPQGLGLPDYERV